MAEVWHVLDLMASAQQALAAAQQPPRADAAAAGGPAPSKDAVDHGVMRLKAMELLQDRKRRSGLFGKAMFGEPAWDMLLALYVHDWTGARFTVSALIEHLGTPTSSASRWLLYLSAEGLIHREEHPTDRRKCFVSLSSRGRSLIETYLGDARSAVAKA